MKLIKELEELIEDEIRDVKKYAKMAVELKDENPISVIDDKCVRINECRTV